MTFVMLKIDYTHIYERERAAALLVYMVLREHTLSPSHSFFLLHARTNQTSQFFLDNFQFVINAIFQGFNCFELKMHSMSFLSGCFTTRIVRRSFWWVCACVCVQCMWVLWFVPIAYMSHCLQCRFCLNFSLFLFSFRMVHHLDPYWPIFTHLHIGESFFCSFFIQQWHASIDKNETFVEPKKNFVEENLVRIMFDSNHKFFALHSHTYTRTLCSRAVPFQSTVLSIERRTRERYAYRPKSILPHIDERIRRKKTIISLPFSRLNWNLFCQTHKNWFFSDSVDSEKWNVLSIWSN